MGPEHRSETATLGDRYVIERELKRGGMATVYLARDVRHDRPVAVKVMRPEVSASVDTARFLREVRVVAQLNHPHVLALHDSGRAVGTFPIHDGEAHSTSEVLYYVTPYVEGESLRDRLRREGHLSVPDALRIASEVADALAFAHARGIVHRDIKPENILLAAAAPGSSLAGHALVADFGIARVAAERSHLTAPGMSVGTPAYMSPEQATGEVVDARTDIYSLGCVLYEMLVGEPPFTGPTVPVIVARHLTAAVASIRTVRPSVPASLEEVVRHALEKAPAARVPSAAVFKTTLDRIRARVQAESSAQHAARATAASQAPPSARTAGGRWLWLLVVAGVMALLISSYFSIRRP